MPFPRHPNKDIRAALALAESRGWRFVASNGHPFGRIKCPCGHPECQHSVWSTPKNPANHARHLERMVARCRACDEHEGDG